MAFNSLAEKISARQLVHDTLAVPAVYRSKDGTVTNDKVTVRWHNKMSRNGAADDGFDASVIEGINRLVFNVPNLAAAGLDAADLARGDTITIAAQSLAGQVFTLEAQERSDGPLSIYWSVSHTDEEDD